MPRHTKLWYFEHFGLIQALNERQRHQVETMAQMQEVKRGAPIYLTGDPSTRLYILKAGAVKIARRTSEGEAILALLHPGDVFGELAMIDTGPRDHFAEAYEDSIVCAIDRDLLQQLIRTTPELGFQITKMMGQRVQRFQSRVEELLCKSAHARLAHALLELADGHGVSDTEGVLIPLRLSQTDLGRLVGLRRETINGILQEWREQGLVEADRRAIRLRNSDALKRISAGTTASKSSPSAEGSWKGSA